MPTQLHDVHRTLSDAARELLLRKARDYAGEADALATLKASAALGVDPSLNVVLRMNDKLHRLKHLIGRDPAVRDEAVRDTVIDLINYAILYYALEQERHAHTPGYE